MLTGELQKPGLIISHNRAHKLFAIACEIPAQTWNVTRCHLNTEQELDLSPQKKTQHCLFHLEENDLFSRLGSLKIKEVTCNYTVNTQPPSVSPPSDPHAVPGKQIEYIILVAYSNCVQYYV